MESDTIEITPSRINPTPSDPSKTSQYLTAASRKSDSSDVEDVDWQISTKPASSFGGIAIKLPNLSSEAKAHYGNISGHSRVRKVLEEATDGTCLVELDSKEVETVLINNLEEFENGEAALFKYRLAEEQAGLRPKNSVVVPDHVDLSMSTSSESESDVLDQSGPRKRTRLYEIEYTARISSDSSDQDELASSSGSSNQDRRPRRAVAQKQSYKIVDLGSSEDELHRPLRRTTRRKERRSKAATSEASSAMVGARRSERNRTVLRRSLKERQEDDISSASENEVGIKLVGAKEQFVELPKDDPFRLRHRADCDVCNDENNSAGKGPLIFCQSCTVAYHKRCLGHRGTRQHVVTKVGEALFVLQCRRCVGHLHHKDKSAPHLGHCSLYSCDKAGNMSKPLRKRLTTTQEQLQREENGGTDPITPVDPRMINNIDNVMFRCATCQRAWHMHHLPKRETLYSQAGDDIDEGSLIIEQLAQKRFDHYHRSWTCKDCVENQAEIDTVVAWRPIDVQTYTPGTTLYMMRESQKEYLIKWRNQSYLRVTWMPATWVWGTQSSGGRAAFWRREYNSMPRMTTADAIPEDFLRVDIVFDVEYTSVVRNSSKDIDMVRVKEVKVALVKYKGLGYEDSIWENPPTTSDPERWADFKSAYEDYVAKVYMTTPSASTYNRYMASIRKREFATLVKTAQPSNVTGGELMQYQLEGLNWLHWQWFRGHNAILADEMGLGKTIQLIAFFASMVHEYKCWPFLVVVPNSICPNWRREVKKWAPSLRIVMYYGSEKARKMTRDFELFPKFTEQDGTKKSTEPKDMRAHIVVTSYESINEPSTRLNLSRVPWKGLVVDEGQRLKNDKSLIYETLSKFNFPFKVLLTGTPLQNNQRELFNLIQFLDKSKNAAELEAKYSDLTQDSVAELHTLLLPYFLRRTKVQVLTFLPAMAQIIIPVTMTVVQKRVAKSIISQNPHLMRSIFNRDHVGTKDRINLNNILMQLRKALCHPFVYNRDIEERTNNKEASHRGLVEASCKLQLLQIMLPKLKERGHRVLLFSQFLDNLDVMEDFLDGLGFLHRRLDGSINALEKQKRIDEFNAPDSPYFAFLLSTRAGGVGINLATTDTVIILDPDFNPHQDIQALSRAHRIGQKNKVIVFQLMTKNSAEEKIMAIGKKKMALDHVLIERMGQKDDEAGEDLESILKFGAATLFNEGEQNEDDIVYDSASVDKLLDRSQIETTQISEEKSAESQFSYARIWANNKDTLEDGLADVPDEAPPNPEFWDKILEQREKAYQEEQARKAEALGRGKRRRGAVDYNLVDADHDHAGSPDGSSARPHQSDDEFATHHTTTTSSSSSDDADSSLPPPNPRTVRARPFKRITVPAGPPPYFINIPTLPVPQIMPLSHSCSACNERHPLGWCRLKLAGYETCNLCGIAHVGHARTCPHLNTEKAVEDMLASLRESTESRSIVNDATKYLRLIRSDLISRRRQKEKEASETLARSTKSNKAFNLNGSGGGGGGGVAGDKPIPQREMHTGLNVNQIRNGVSGVSPIGPIVPKQKAGGVNDS